MITKLLITIFIGLPILIIYFIYDSFKNNRRQQSYTMTPSLKELFEEGGKKKNAEQNLLEEKMEVEQNPLTNKYQACSLLTTTEYNFYTILKEKCDIENYIICPKVRLEDFINVTAQDRMKYRGYIKSRHVDFVICDSWLKVIATIELDDPSHNTPQAQATDNFKNELFDAIGIPLFRIEVNDFYVIRITEVLEQLKEHITKENEKIPTSEK